MPGKYSSIAAAVRTLELRIALLERGRAPESLQDRALRRHAHNEQPLGFPVHSGGVAAHLAKPIVGPWVAARDLRLHR
eukprot:4646098-Lingulodinium_polyedra.AAC.1